MTTTMLPPKSNDLGRRDTNEELRYVAPLCPTYFLCVESRVPMLLAKIEMGVLFSSLVFDDSLS